MVSGNSDTTRRNQRGITISIDQNVNDAAGVSTSVADKVNGPDAPASSTTVTGDMVFMIGRSFCDVTVRTNTSKSIPPLPSITWMVRLAVPN